MFNGTSLNTDSRPTPDETYDAALIVGDLAKMAEIIYGQDISEADWQTVMHGLSVIPSACGEILDISLDRCVNKGSWKDVC